MALFSSKTEKKHDAAKIAGAEKATKVVKAKKVAKKAKAIEGAITSPAVKAAKTPAVVASKTAPVSVIIAPHMTEKAGIQHEAGNIYTFKVAGEATKGSVTKAIKAAYKVTPVKVNMINIPERPITYRGRPSTASGYKKAMVFLKKGDKIDFAA